jgi:carbon monoxide dehydrogenase subunit G
MELSHQFTVPVPVQEAWDHFQDIASVAECFPGAAVTSVEDGTFQGSVKVKLGPIALVYNGSGTFTEKDETAHRFVVDAKGKDKRGNGTAGATVTLAMTPKGESTDVKVDTDLAITGKPAQFGRGMMQDVSDKLLGQFVACLEKRMGTDDDGQTPGAPAAAAPEVAAAAVPDPAAPAPAAAPSAAVPPAHARPAPSTRDSDDALDLGAAVLPVLAKAYWKQAVGALVVVGVVVWVVTR